MNSIQIIDKSNKEAFKLLTEMGLFEKYATDKHDKIYVTHEQYAIGYAIQEIDKIKKKIELMEAK